MLKEQIRSYFKKKGHFAMGLRLLAMTGERPQLLARLQTYLQGNWVPADAKSALQGALKAYLKNAPETVTPAKEVVIRQQVHQPIDAPAQVVQEDPPAILQLREEAKQYHKQQAELKGRLNLMTEDRDNYTNEQRAAVAQEMMQEVIPRLDSIYDTIRRYKKTGEVPKSSDEKSIIAQTIEKMNRLQKILPPRISKLKKYLRDKKRGNKDLTQEELTNYQKELLEKETEKAQLGQELGLQN